MSNSFETTCPNSATEKTESNRSCFRYRHLCPIAVLAAFASLLLQLCPLHVIAEQEQTSTAIEGHSGFMVRGDSQTNEFYLKHSSGTLFGPYECKDGEKVLNGHGLLIISTNNAMTAETNQTFRVRFSESGITLLRGPFEFKNGTQLRLGQHTMTLLTENPDQLRTQIKEQKVKQRQRAEQKRREDETRRREELARQEEQERQRIQYEASQEAKGLTKYNGQWMTPQEAEQQRNEKAWRQYIATHYPRYYGLCNSASDADRVAQRLNAQAQGQLDAMREYSMSGGGAAVGHRVGRYTYTYDRNLDRFVVYQE